MIGIERIRDTASYAPNQYLDRIIMLKSLRSLFRDNSDTTSKEVTRDSSTVPSDIPSRSYAHGVIVANRHNNLENMRRNKIEQFTLISCDDGLDCEWCKSTQSIVLPTSLDLEAEIEAHCTCTTYCKCLTRPILKF